MTDPYASLHLDGKSIVVFGAANGIGRETAILLGSRGASVTLAGISDEPGAAAVKEITAAGGTAQWVHADITDAAQAEAAVAAAVDAYGGLHGAFNNAGIAILGELHETTEEDWRRSFDVNVTGTFLAMKYEIAHMLEHGGGSIVNNSSVVGVKSMAGAASYVASKHGVVGLTRAASHDYAARGIRVNAILPHVVRTPMFDSAPPELIAEFASALPIGRVGEMNEPAEQVAWLLSDASTYSTGSLFPVDGGFNAV